MVLSAVNPVTEKRGSHISLGPKSAMEAQEVGLPGPDWLEALTFSLSLSLKPEYSFFSPSFSNLVLNPATCLTFVKSCGSELSRVIVCYETSFLFCVVLYLSFVFIHYHLGSGMMEDQFLLSLSCICRNIAAYTWNVEVVELALWKGVEHFKVMVLKFGIFEEKKQYANVVVLVEPKV